MIFKYNIIIHLRAMIVVLPSFAELDATICNIRGHTSDKVYSFEWLIFSILFIRTVKLEVPTTSIKYGENKRDEQ